MSSSYTTSVPQAARDFIMQGWLLSAAVGSGGRTRSDLLQQPGDTSVGLQALG